MGHVDPDVRLKVTTDDRPVDMFDEGYAPDETLIGRIFLRDRLVVVAPPSLARPVGANPVPAVVRGQGDQATG